MADTKVDDGGNPPQGWYPDPEDSSYLRRWDGAAWTEERVPASRGRRRLRAQDEPEAGATSADPLVAGHGPASVGSGVADVSAEQADAPAPSSHDLELELRRRQAEIDRLVEREQGLVEAVERRRAEIAEIAEREDALIQSLRQAREELARIEQQVAVADTVEARLAELTAAEASTAEEIDRRRAELDDVVRETAEAHDRAASERAEAQSLVVAVRAEHDRLRTAVEQVREDHAAAAAEADETARLLEDLTRRREDLVREHDDLMREHEELVRRHDGVVAEHEELTRLHQDLLRQQDEVAGQLEARRAELDETEARLAAARTELVDLGERVAVQDFGLYDYKHPAEDSAVLATQLAGLREAIVQTLRAGEAITVPTNFKLGYSAAKGQQVAAEVSALSLRAYNAEAENAVRTAGPGGIDGALTRLIRARDAVARHGAWLGVAITDKYHALRAQEIEMAGEYKIRKEREAAAAPVPGASGGVPREYVPGAGTEYGTGGSGYVPGAGGPGYGAGAGYGSGASYGSGAGYVPGAGASGAGADAPGYSGADAGQAANPSYGAWEPQSSAAPVSSNGRSGR